MPVNAKKLKKIILSNIPYVIFFYAGNKIAFAYRTAPGAGMSEKLSPFLTNLAAAFSDPLPSFNAVDLLVALAIAAVTKILLTIKQKNRKKFRNGEEYGSAKWGTENDIEPYIDSSDFSNNIILTQTERLTMGKPSAPKYARNKNVEIIGGSGSGKTRFFVKPNLMQMHSSYVVTDPKGTVLIECGKMLQRGRPHKIKNKQGKTVTIYEPYKIKVFNTIDFFKSMHYNPFAYIDPKHREKDILKFVNVLIKNTNGTQQQGGGDFWEKAERLLYQAYIAMIYCFSPPEERNFETLIDMINLSECREDDETFKNAIDVQFEFVEKWINNSFCDEDELEEDYEYIKKNFTPDEEQMRIGKFAVKQYKAYKLAAGNIK